MPSFESSKLYETFNPLLISNFSFFKKIEHENLTKELVTLNIWRKIVEFRWKHRSTTKTHFLITFIRLYRSLSFFYTSPICSAYLILYLDVTYHHILVKKKKKLKWYKGSWYLVRSHLNGLISGEDKRESQSASQLFCLGTVNLLCTVHVAVVKRTPTKQIDQVGDAHDESHVSSFYARVHLIGCQTDGSQAPIWLD